MEWASHIGLHTPARALTVPVVNAQTSCPAQSPEIDTAAGAKQGSCGYGQMDSGSWPYFSCVGISESSSLFGLPGKGCGVCVEVQCVESGPVRARPPHCMRRLAMRDI